MNQISDAELARMNRPRVWLFTREPFEEPPCWELRPDGTAYLDLSAWEELLPEDFTVPGVGLWVAVDEYRRPDPEDVAEWEEMENGGEFPYAYYTPSIWCPASVSDLVALKLLPETTFLGYSPAAQAYAEALEEERDVLWAAMQRIALNLCDCDARDGEECPVEPSLHREHCNYSLAHWAPAKEDDTPLECGDNFSLASGEG